MINVLPQVGDKFILHCIAEPSEEGLVTKVLSIEPATKEKPKSEAEKLQDLLSDVGNDAFCKIMAETIEKHNTLHVGCRDVLSGIRELCSNGLNNLAIKAAAELQELIEKQLDK